MQITDAQIHVWGSGLPSNRSHIQVTSFTAEQAIELMDEAGVDAAVIHPPSWDPNSTEMALAAVERYPGRFAVMGSSKPRGAEGFEGLALAERLEQSDVEAQCGLVVVDLDAGEPVHWLKIGGAVEELYDVALMPGVKRPMSIGFQSDEIRRVISIEE